MDKIPTVQGLDKHYIAAVNFDDELEGGNELFAIRPVLLFADHGNTMVAYGLFNRETNIREGEYRQLATALTWVDILTEAAKGNPIDAEAFTSAEGSSSTIQ